MKIDTESQLRNTQTKLRLIQEQILKAQHRLATPERDVSIQALADMADQLRGEMAEYEKTHQTA